MPEVDAAYFEINYKSRSDPYYPTPEVATISALGQFLELVCVFEFVFPARPTHVQWDSCVDYGLRAGQSNRLVSTSFRYSLTILVVCGLAFLCIKMPYSPITVMKGITWCSENVPVGRQGAILYVDQLCTFLCSYT